ncbi:T3SS (YopN, CesT) and YbjN peptide-binding chaperone 1 [Pseudomonas sp.]|uniref:T3SS (YopN, CesT) and YbjN peptide-binding chaperone 1 n=1 Tax=Pseudomonas sp. TaxID=306 RepID=UPI003D0B1874
MDKSTPAEKSRISKVYIDVLEDLGLNPKVDEDGDVEFDSLSSKGYRLIAIIDADHEEFIRIAFPGVGQVTDNERTKLLEACNFANVKSKGAKVYINTSGRYVWAAYEVIIEKFSKKRLYELISVSSVVLESASEKFQSYLRENS